MNNLEKLLKDVKKDLESDLVDIYEEIDVEKLTQELKDFLKELKEEKGFPEKEKSCEWECNNKKEQDDFFEDFGKFLDKIQREEEAEEKMESKKYVDPYFNEKVEAIKKAKKEKSHTYENWTFTPTKDSQYIIKVEWTPSANRVHTNLVNAYEEAKRLIRKENRKVYIYKAITVFSPWEIQIESL